MKRTITIMLICIMITAPGYCDTIFNKIVRAINNKATSLQLSALVDENINKPIAGKGYVIDIAKNSPTGVVLTLSTTRSIYSSYFISVKLFVSDEYIKQALKLRKGSYVRFSGTLKNVVLNEILVENGSLKKPAFMFF